MSTSLERQIKRRRKMGNGKMRVPAIGGAPQQQAFDITQAIWRSCSCGHGIFEKLYRLGTISKLAAGNRTGQDLNVELPARYLCRSCGKELGKAVKAEEGKQ